MKVALLFLLGCLAANSAAAQSQDRPAMVIVLVIDGLRPDSITAEVMPNLHRLKTSGVWYTRSHSIFPTVTRANATSISTGTRPSQHGIVSNSVYLPTVSPTVLSNGDYRNLLSLAKVNGGRVVRVKSLGEYFEAAGVRYVAISSGSTGNALLLNPTAPFGKGSLINPGFENNTRVAFPDELNAELLKRFGTVQGGEDADQTMLWTERVLREYVLGTMRPQVIIDWMGRSDSAQHSSGVGSPRGLAALRLVDQQIGLLQGRVREMGLEDKTDFIVTCDHGFDYEPSADLRAPLRDSGIAAEDVVTDNEGGSTLFYVKGHDAEKIARLAAKYQAHEMTNVVFTAAKRPVNGDFQCSLGAEKGYVPGTFALEIAGQCVAGRGPDLIVTYRWNDAANPFGVPGTQFIPGTGAAKNGHGGLNPYTTHSTLIAAGPNFGESKTVDVPAGNQDIAPTLLNLFGVTVPASLDGRVLSEAMGKPAQGKPSTKKVQASAGSYCGELVLSYTGNRVYLDQGQRCSGKR